MSRDMDNSRGIQQSSSGTDRPAAIRVLGHWLAVLGTGLCALLPAPAAATPIGGLTQLPSPDGCISRVDHGGRCSVEAFPSSPPAALAVSPDGLHVYVATGTGIVGFARHADGRLARIPGAWGCVGDGSQPGCSSGRALTGIRALALSPDGRHLYVAAQGADGVAVFARDEASGELSQLALTSGCITETGLAGVCADGRALNDPADIASSPDGAHVYVAGADGVAVLRRDSASGALSQDAAAVGCLTESGSAGCTAAASLGAPKALALAPGGSSLYLASERQLVVLSRDANTGGVAQLAGAAGCFSASVSACTQVAGLIQLAGLAVSGDGESVYALGAPSNDFDGRFGLTTFTRASDGALAFRSCLGESAPCRRGSTGDSLVLSPDGRSIYVGHHQQLEVLGRSAAGDAETLPTGTGTCLVNAGGGPCGRADALADVTDLAVAPDGRHVYAVSPGGESVLAFDRSTTSGPPRCEPTSAAVWQDDYARVLLPCTDPTGDPLRYEIVEQPAHGRVIHSGDGASDAAYRPSLGYVGTDRFVFRASDGVEFSDPAVAHVDVACRPCPGPPPEPPGPPPPPSRGASPRTTFLLSRALDGGLPNGISRNPAVSHDQRIASLMAFESDASDIVAGDTNGATDVFVVRRRPPAGVDGDPWEPDTAQIVSKARDGGAANGRSYRPALDGDSHHAPRCVAFVSAASNLVTGDTNRQPDAFVRDLRTGRTVRVSVDSGGRQATGPTTEVELDGECSRVAFVADAPNLALTRTRRRGWSSLRTARPRRGRRQVYVRVLRGALRGATFLASAGRRGVPANGDSFELAFARNGESVAFTSAATNLAAGDRSAGYDVYKRDLGGRRRVLLVSSTPGGGAGNGPSRHPAITDVGRYVAFDTRASNLLPNDDNQVADIARADTAGRRPSHRWVSLSAFVGRPGDGPSERPTISGAGEFVLFQSDATNLKQSQHVQDDGNGARDVFLWNAPTGNVSLESRDSFNRYLRTASHHPVTSSRGNYVPFESADPLIDEVVAERRFPDFFRDPMLLDPQLVPPLLSPARISVPNGAGRSSLGTLQQVYVRYLGPK